MRLRRRSIRARGGQPRPRGVRSKPWFAAAGGEPWRRTAGKPTFAAVRGGEPSLLTIASKTRKARITCVCVMEVVGANRYCMA